jgi:hypothetical protein
MLRKMFKIIGITAAVLMLLIVAGLVYFNASFPKAEPPVNVTVELTPERIARGEYLANHVNVCIDCHSNRDWSKFSGPIIPGTEARGGDEFGKEMGFPGTIYAKNITPANLGNWTDGEIIRAITTGVNKHNEALFPIMPYYNYNQMSEEDVYSIVAYLRTLPPIENTTPAPELDFPLNFLVKTMPINTYQPPKQVNKENTIEYGKYLVTLASCADCHTPTNEKMEPLPGMDFAGGMEFYAPIGTIRSVNITPHDETGIGKWTKEEFINRFKSFDPAVHEVVSVKPTDFNTPMPWIMYAGMTEEDLGAIYDYLRTLKPKNNFVNRFTPAK